jgi:NADH-quinone oxidoreductase subunit J
LFWPLAVLVIMGALQVVRVGNIFHAGLSLVLTFGGVAALYGLLAAYFIAAIQVLIYVGAIAVILEFAVMLTQHISTEEEPVPLLRRVGAGCICLLFALLGCGCVNAYHFNQPSPPRAHPLTVIDIGQQFLGKSNLLLPFELIAVLLLIALIGAVMVAYKEER